MAVDCVEYNVCGVLVYTYCVIQKPIYIYPSHFPQITHQCIFKSYWMWVCGAICKFNFPLFSFRPSCVNVTCRKNMFGIKQKGLPGKVPRIRRLMYMNSYSSSLQIDVFRLYKCDFWFSWVEISYFGLLDCDTVELGRKFSKKIFHRYQVKKW